MVKRNQIHFFLPSGNGKQAEVSPAGSEGNWGLEMLRCSFC